MRKTRQGNRNRAPWELFRGPAVFLYRRLLLRKKSDSAKKLEEQVIALHLGDRRSAAAYQIEKIEQVMAAAVVMLVLTAAAFVFSACSDDTVPGNRLKRDTYGGITNSRELVAQIEEASEAGSFSVSWQARRYSTEQAERLLREARDELEQGIRGENASLDHVDQSLYFPDRLAGGAVSVTYLTVPYGIISDQGEITGRPDREGSLVEINATLTCQEEELVFEQAAMVFPEELKGMRLLREKVREALEEADREQAESEFFELPEEVEGHEITWREPSDGLWRMLLFWCVIIPPAIWLARDAAVRQKARDRLEQMQLDYPDILWRLTMLLGAGITLRHAFARVASGYERNRKAGGGERYAYEEMRYTLREMEAGMGEAAAYEHFGRRCGLPGYIKLGSLLAVSVRKGTGELRQSLEKEADMAMEERKNQAIRTGERAGTKMLFPMILMLGVVILVLVVPAFMSMS